MAATAALATAALLGGCAAGAPDAPLRTPSSSASADPGAGPATGPLQPTGSPTVIASGLNAPWSVMRLTPDLADGGSSLISERDTGRIRELTADGSLRDAGRVPGVAAAGEGGLLGLAALREGDRLWLYAYLTTASDNRIVRMPVQGAAGGLTLGAPGEVVTGLPKAGNHNGGRIAFGPDGMLYATVGDAGQPQRAQDRGSLGGKILRMTPDGAAPAGNPFPGSLVYSFGHRNPQGLDWGDDGTLYASEFGQNTWDELNIISAGQNYGWPVHEGIADADGYVNPVYQWSTGEASPSGLASIGGTLFMAALRGERLWSIWVGPESVTAEASYAGEFGRLRDAVEGPDGTLWVLTNNTDGRGRPHEGDDKLLQVQLIERQPG